MDRQEQQQCRHHTFSLSIIITSTKHTMKLSIAAALVTTTLGSYASAFVVPTTTTATTTTTMRNEARRLVVTAAAEPELGVLEKMESKPTDVLPIAMMENESNTNTAITLASSTPTLSPSDPRQQIQPGRYDSLSYSLTLPFLERPTKLDGSHAGDYGFDPFGFTEQYDLYYMQECELRHARLAMLAVAGWPLSELMAPQFMLQDGGRAPSVLNGVNPLSFLGIAGALAALGYFEYKTSLRRTTGTKLGDVHTKDMALIWKYGVAGDYNFDPQNLYNILGDDAAGRKALREVEVTQGRWAMLGITYFAAWEALTGHAIVENNPFFTANPILPLAAISYFVWSQFYQISDLRKFPITIEYTKDGEEMLRAVNRNTKAMEKDVSKLVEIGTAVAEQTVKLSKMAAEKVKDLQDEA